MYNNHMLDLEAVKMEIICLKKNSRSSAVTAISNKIIGLIVDDRNLQEVKEQLIHVDNAFQRLREAHHDYSSKIIDEGGIAEYQLYLESEERKFGLFRLQIADWIAGNEEKFPAEPLQIDSVVKLSRRSSRQALGERVSFETGRVPLKVES